MPDYNIYIHSDPNGNSDPTKPWKNGRTATSSKEDGGDGGETAAKVLNTISNPDSLVARGISLVTKAIPYIAVAYAVKHIVDTAISTTLNFNAITSGNYAGKVAYNNFKATLSASLRPFSTTLNYFQYQEQMKVQREKAQLTQELLGESVINSRFGGKGV